MTREATGDATTRYDLMFNVTANAASLISPPTLAARLFALLTPARSSEETVIAPAWLSARAEIGWEAEADLEALVEDWLAEPQNGDINLARLARALHLNISECMALVLCHAASSDAHASRALAWLLGGERAAGPTPGLIASLDARRGLSSDQSLAALLDGEAVASGLLRLDCRDCALPDTPLAMPLPVLLALAGGVGAWPNISLDDQDLPPLAQSIQSDAVQRAAALTSADALLVRSGHPREAWAACVAIARAQGKRAALIEGEVPAGLLPWLLLHDAWPVLLAEYGPGERHVLPDLTRGRLPLLVAAGSDGYAELRGQNVPSWRVPVPNETERAELWRAQAADPDNAWALGAAHRHCGARIEELARAARRLSTATERASVDRETVARAARQAGQGALGTLAELLPEDIDERAMVLPSLLRRDLHDLAARCRLRDGLADGLGIAARSRYRPGVRALFVGASGTGKTLACGWLATHLGLPLYRVDLASVTSKYIGETEKNLSELFARAESAEVVLLFDEADALFGKRTEVKNANDRFANQQTNYLLQRIESYDGIVLLTSNSRARFDSAFTRRLDAIFDFPQPGPEERRDLWLAHLGLAHDLTPAQINRLAATCDLCGGHIRNATLMAAVAARSERRNISFADVQRGIAAEYRKLGRQLPGGVGAI